MTSDRLTRDHGPREEWLAWEASEGVARVSSFLWAQPERRDVAEAVFFIISWVLGEILRRRGASMAIFCG